MQPLTMIDFPGRLATVLFAQGCNLRCRFCYICSLLPASSPETIAWSQVINFLRDRQGFIEGVVFSGGEPCQQPGLMSAMEEVRELGYEIALHTNGYYPEVVNAALEKRLLQFIAVDFKAPFDLYEGITGTPMIEKSFAGLVDAIVASGVKHEFRTTFHPLLIGETDLLRMADWLAERKVCSYAVQQFKHGAALDNNLKPVNDNCLSPAALLRLRSRFLTFELRNGSGVERSLARAA
jgi:pyruvate formate lyase activating enzyme